MTVIRRDDDKRPPEAVAAMQRFLDGNPTGRDLYDFCEVYVAERTTTNQGAVSTLTSVRVWAEIVRDRHSDEHVRRHMVMLLALLDGEDPDARGQS